MKSTVSLALVVFGSILAVACGKKDASSDGPAAPSASAAVAATTAAVPTVVATATATHEAVADGASISGCCASLRSAEGTAKSTEKGKYESAAATCDGIAALVKSGRTPKSAALGQIRAALHGDALPAGCN